MNENFKREFELYEAENESKKATAKFIGIGLLTSVIIIFSIAVLINGIAINNSDILSNTAIKADENSITGKSTAVLSELHSQSQINAGTNMVYEYYFPEMNLTDYIEAAPPSFLIGASENVLKTTIPEWDIIKFSSTEIILRKTIFSSDELVYILTSKDGYLAVYYEDSVYGGILKEVTSIPISGLNDDELSYLEKGIQIYGLRNLLDALQDYGS